jgi:shikimate 5-dehydrogenase
MAIRCPKCKREYDVTLFEFGREVVCDCGYRLGLEHEEVFNQLEELCRHYDLELEEERLMEIKRAQDKIAFLIMNTDYEEVDIEIEKTKFKELIKGLFPEKAYLYELIYEPRFKRLWDQFRKAGQ